MLQVEYFSGDFSIVKSINLAHTPTASTNVAMDLVGGTAQAWGTLANDFGVVDGTTVTWDDPSYNLYYTPIDSSDTIRIIYDY